MKYLIFFSLSSIYLILGLASVVKFKYNKLALKLFFALTILLPIGKLTTKFHTNWQVSSYYFFFIGCGLLFFCKLINFHKINKKALITLVFIVSTILLLLFHYLIFGDKDARLIDVLKDLKPYALFIAAITFLEIYKDKLQIILTRKFCNKLLFVNFIVTSILFFFMLRYDLHLKLTDDPYFKYEEIRLETLGIFFGGFYLLYLFIKNEKPTIKEIFFSAVPLLYTGNRTMIFGILILIVFIYLSKLTLKKIVLIFMSGIIGIVSLTYLVSTALENSPFFRIKKLFDNGYIADAFKTRFSPFINSVAGFSTMDYFSGRGIGHTFYIKWFVWRAEIDNYNIYLDNLYLTLYTKYGIISIVFFIIFYLFLISYRGLKASNYYLLLFLLIAVTNSFCYQFNFLWFLLLIAIPYSFNKQEI